MCFQWISLQKKGELFWSSRNHGKVCARSLSSLGAIDLKEFLGKLQVLLCSLMVTDLVAFSCQISPVMRHQCDFCWKWDHLQAFLGSTSLVSFFLKRIPQTSSIWMKITERFILPVSLSLKMNAYDRCLKDQILLMEGSPNNHLR